MKKSPIPMIVVLTVVIGVIAWFFVNHKPSNKTPDGAIKGSVACLRDDDIKGLLERVLTPDDYAKLKKDFESKPKMSASDKAQFNAALTQISADNAEDTIYQLIKPKLAEAQGGIAQIKSGIPSMIEGIVAMQGSTKDADKKTAQEMGTAIGKWIGDLKLDDEAKAKKAIGIVCSTVRKLKIKNADELDALTFDQALDKGGKALAGVKKVLDIYGLSLNDTLGSVKVGKPEISGETATVPVTSTMLGVTTTQSAKLKKTGDRWYVDIPK